MAGAFRDSDLSIKELLFKKPQSFGFFQAVRLLHLIRGTEVISFSKDIFPDSLVRFRTRASLEFPASEIYDLVIPKRDPAVAENWAVPDMITSFMGLTGQSGVLPQAYTELLIERWSLYKDDTAHRFFDLFNHRAITLFVQAREKYRFYIPYEYGSKVGLTQYLLDVIGMGSSHLRQQVTAEVAGLKEEALAYYSGLLAQRPRSSSTLAAILTDYFGIKIVVYQCCGRWLAIPQTLQTSLGQKNNRLGDDLVLGDRAWDRQGKFRVILGPLTLTHYQSFLPNGAAYHVLMKFIRWFIGPSLEFDIQLILKNDEIPEIRLGVESGCYLGWLGWLKSKPFSKNVQDAVLIERNHNDHEPEISDRAA